MSLDDGAPPSVTAIGSHDGGVAPVSDADFAAWLDALIDGRRPDRMAVAVSGGGDSMALLVLAVVTVFWFRRRPPPTVG